MYLLYLDDSGSVSNPSEKYFVLGGVCVPEASVRWLGYELEKLAEDIDPVNPRSVEFHAAEIFSGRRGVWKGLNISRRAKIHVKDVPRILIGNDKPIAT